MRSDLDPMRSKTPNVAVFPNISLTQFHYRCCFGCKLSTKIFNFVCREIRGDPQNMTRWEKLCSKVF